MAWSMGISAVLPAVAATAPADGSIIKLASNPAVYLVSGGKKINFTNRGTYSSWSNAIGDVNNNFTGLKVVSQADFDMLGFGGNVTVRTGSVLVQFNDSAAVYAVGTDKKLYQFADAAAQTALYPGFTVVRLDSSARALYYDNGNPVATLTASSNLPDGTFVKASGSADVYMLEGGLKRPLTTDAATANFVKASWVVTTDVTKYSNGSAISGKEGFSTVAGGGASGGTGITGSVTVALAADTPTSKSVPSTVSRAPFTKVNLTASNNGSVAVESMVVKRSGLTGSYAQISKVWAEQAGVIVASKRTLNSNDEVTLTFAPVLTIPAGQTISLDIVAELTAATGNAALGVTSVNGNAVSAVGNLMSFVDYSVTWLTVVPTVSTSTVSVGDEAVELGKFNIDFSTSTRDVVLSSIMLRNTKAEDLSNALMNIYLENGGERVSANGVISGRYVTINFNSGYTMLKDDDNKTFTIKGDVIGRDGAGALDLRLNKKEDLVAHEKATGFGVTLGHLDDLLINDIQVNSGIVAISKKTASPSDTTVVKGASSVVALLANIKADEAINADALKINYKSSDAGVSFTNAKVYLNNVLLGSFDPVLQASYFSETIDSTLSLRKGDNEVKVTVDVRSTASSTATFSAQLVGTALLTAPEYVSNGNAVSSSDISGTATGAIITVQAGELSVTRNDGYAANRSIVKGSTDVSLGKFAVKANNDAIKITSILLSGNTGSVTKVLDSSVSDMKLFVDGVQVGTTRNFTSGGATFSSLNYSIAKDVTKVFELKGSFDTASTGTLLTTLTFNSQDSVGKTLDKKSAATTQLLVEDEGTLTIALAADNPSSAILIAPLSGQEVARYKLTAVKDSANITELTLTNYGTTTPTSTSLTDPRIASYGLYVGSTLIGEESPAGTGVVTFNLAANKLVIPANGSVDLMVKVNLNAIELSSETNMPISLGISGVKAKASNGTDLGSGSITVTPTHSNLMVVRKGKPVFTKLSGISSSQGAVQQIGEFKIDAVGEDVELTRLTVSVSGTGSASTSAFILQEVGKSTDLATSTAGAFSGFSTIISKGSSKTYRVFANTNNVGSDKTFGITISDSAATNLIVWNEYFVADDFVGSYNSSYIMSSAIDFGTMKY